MENIHQDIADAADDFFAELEAEISVATKAARLKAEIENNRKKSFNTKLSRDDRAEAKALYLEAEAIMEAARWESIGTVALFSEQRCDGCGSTHRIFLQYMEKQHFASNHSTTRMVRTTSPRAGLPRFTMLQTSLTHICADCCIDHDFSFDSFDQLNCSPVAPSPTYQQDDIYAQAEEG